MEDQLFILIASALGAAPIVTGITEVIKENTRLNGIGVIILAIILAVALFGGFAYIFDFPMSESLLTGVLTGFASVGAFESIDKTIDVLDE